MAESSLTIRDFCEIEKLSRGSFYKLDRTGKAPLTYRVGVTRRITPEAHQAWRRAQEAEAAKRRETTEEAA